MAYRESGSPLPSAFSKPLSFGQTDMTDSDLGAKPIVWAWWVLGVTCYLTWWCLTHQPPVVPVSPSEEGEEEEPVGEHVA